MATSVSAWGKPGAWALDSEQHEEELIQQQEEETKEISKSFDFSSQKIHNQSQVQPLSDFPSLSTAAVTKTKKKKPQTVSLSEFTTGKSVTYGASNKTNQSAKGLTPDELLILPTGPRERSAEELERSSSRLGGGFRSYGSGDNNGRNSRYSNSDDSSNNRWGSSRGSSSDEPRRNGGFNRESGPSKADEIDDWGAAKKSMGVPSFERRERGSGGGFFDSQSRADESDSWLSKKSFVPSETRRIGGGGYERERRGGFEKEISNGGGADSDNWGKKRGEEGSEKGRPKLVLQPRSLTVSNGEQQPGSGSVAKSNPFGAARPREEVLAEKGQDYKKIDEQLESVKIKEMGLGSDGSSIGKKSFGSGNGRISSPEDRTERSWRKTDSVDAPSPSVEKSSEEKANEDTVVAED